jgi:hypothetical protein
VPLPPAPLRPTTETANAAPAAAGQTYRLIANPTALSPHVGKKLALTGTLDESASPATASSTGSEPKIARAEGRVRQGHRRVVQSAITNNDVTIDGVR